MLKLKRFAKLESYILDKMIETKIPGLSLGLVYKGEFFERNFGFKDLGSRKPPSSDTLFGLGSITKVFTAVAIMQLQDKGVLNLDDPISNYLAVDFDSSNPILIRHLLSHSSGIPALGYSESKMSKRWWMDGYPIASLDDLLSFMGGASEWVQTQPGKRWFYLNEGYILLGAIIEQISGQAYKDYISENILRPLGMTRSFFNREEVEQDADHATPYLKERDGSHFLGANLYSAIPAAGGLVSTISDMTVFAKVFFTPEAATKPLLSEEALRLMQAPVISLPNQPSSVFSDANHFSGNVRSFGLGLQIQPSFFGQTVISHGGGVMGGTTYMACIPEQNIAVILLSNAHGYPMSHLALVALATLLDKDFEQLDFVQLDQFLHSFKGHYASFRDTIQAEVKLKGGGLELQLQFKHEDRIIPLFPVSLSKEYSQFKTFSGGSQLTVEFIKRETKLELIYERYVFRKQ